jgi:hypothetical protein
MTTAIASSKTYEGPEVAFLVPATWQDRSIVAFAPAPAGKKAAPSFVVTREPLAPEETLRTFASRQVGQIAKNMREFVLHDDCDGTVDGAPSTNHEFSWRSPTGKILQRMTMTVHEGTVWLFTATAPEEDAATLRATFAEMVASVRLATRRPSSAPPPPTSSAPPDAPEDLPPDWWPGTRRR